MFRRTLSLLQQQLVWSLPVAMVIGLAIGPFVPAGFRQQLTLPLTVLMVYPSMVNVNDRSLLRSGDLRLQGTTQVVNFTVIPLLGYTLGRMFFGESAAAVAMLMTALLPMSGMTITWTMLARGNTPAAVRMTLIGLLLGAPATPLYLEALYGQVLTVPLQTLTLQIGLIILLPMPAGWLTQAAVVRLQGAARFEQHWKPKMPLLSTVGVLLIVLTAVAQRADVVIADPMLPLRLLPPLLLLYSINFAVSTLVGRFRLGRGDAIALVYGTVMRNLSIAPAVALTAFGAAGADMALLIALAFVVQVPAAVWYVRLRDRLFGPPPAVGN
jgi:ACR3 family arsenite transporter